jgi:hypothetical protein
MLMKLPMLIVTFILIFVASPVLSADIEGRIWLASSGSTPAQAVIIVTCMDGEKKMASVDRYGLYRVSGLPGKRNCAVKVTYQKMDSNQISVYTGNMRNSANLEIKIYNQRLLLIRR